MKKILLISSILLGVSLLFPRLLADPALVSHAPEVELAVAHAENKTPDLTPITLSIPSIDLNVPIVAVGINGKGEMAVPNGKTNQVGWYKNGAQPGEVGSAVLDAHVFAAFKNLHKMSVGDEVYVTAQDGSTQHFKVVETALYPFNKVPPHLLFTRADGRYLNLITCAGTWLPKLGTYSERLVVYTRLVTP